MKKLKVMVAAFLLGSFMLPNVSAQKLAEEKIVELTGKSKKKGYLGNVVVDDTKQQFDMVFVTKDKAKKVKYEVYQFDYDFNLINNFEDEQSSQPRVLSVNGLYRHGYLLSPVVVQQVLKCLSYFDDGFDDEVLWPELVVA